MKYLNNIAFLLILLFISCGYKYKTFKDENGKLHFYRVYKDYSKQKAHNEKGIFKQYYEPGEYRKYSKQIIEKEVEETISLKYDSVTFAFDIENNEFIEIFRTGLLYPKLIFDNSINAKSKADSTIQEFKKDIQSEVQNELKLWVGKIEELEHFSIGPSKRRFKLWITLFPEQYGYNVYFIEIENEDINIESDIKDFLVNAKLTFIVNQFIIIT